MKTLELEIVGDLPEGLTTEPLQKTFATMLSRMEELPEGTINLTFVDDAAMRELNHTYSGNDYATDVLSFDYREDGGPIGEVIGEIAISYETAARQADEAGTSLSDEVALLGLHGILHILGYNHAETGDQEIVQQFQKDFLTASGVAYREFKWEL
ncbi:MAG: rRNA maturation RNase YbeY [Candidatus Saccharibacteria bacterium]